MTNKEKARLILNEIDRDGPINVDWNDADDWIKLLEGMLAKIEKMEAE